MHEIRRGAAVRIAPQSGAAFRLRRGEILRITDPCGEQVADLFAFNASDYACSLSSGRSIDFASKIFLSTGDVLYSNDSQRMFTIGKDTVGRHDFLLTPCSQEMFEILYKHQGHHPSCFENLFKSFAPFGIRPDADFDDVQRFHEGRCQQDRRGPGRRSPIQARRLLHSRTTASRR